MNRLQAFTKRWAERAIKPRTHRKCLARASKNKETGSISALTLIGVGAIFGAFLYVAVIGNQINTKHHLRSSADAAALAGATVKSRMLNYTSFSILALTVLYPLSQVSHYIAGSEVANYSGNQIQANYGAAVCAGMMLQGSSQAIADACLQYMITTNIGSTREDAVIQAAINGLNTINSGLNTTGSTWAASVATQTALNAAYQTAGVPADLVQIFPTPDGTPTCSNLGTTMTDATSGKTGHGKSAKDACNAQAAYQLAYDAMSMDDTYGPIDTWDWMLANTNPPTSFSCSNVPAASKQLCSMFASNPTLFSAKDTGNTATNLAKQMNTTTAAIKNFLNTRDSYQTQLVNAKANNPPSITDLTSNKANTGCAAMGQVPILVTSWRDSSRTVAMTMQSKPSDGKYIARLESLRKKATATRIPSGTALGIGCAAHYSMDPAGTESLGSLNWRARLVPCDFNVQANVDQVVNCGGKNSQIGLQFQSDLALGIARDWTF